MAYTLEQIEWLHNNGWMPDWAYYQQNGKSAQANFAEQQRKIMEMERQREEEARRQAEEKEREKKLDKALEKALDDLLKGFK